MSRNNSVIFGAGGYDFEAVTIMASDTDPLAQAFAEENTCLRLIPFWEKSSENPAWYAAMVDNGRGIFEVTLFLIATQPHRYMFLGEDVKRGARKACQIMADPTEATWWAPVPGEPVQGETGGLRWT